MVRYLREPHSVVFGVVTDAVLFPRYRRPRMFFVDTGTVIVVVVALAISVRPKVSRTIGTDAERPCEETGWIRTIVGFAFLVPRAEGFSELLQNALTGLTGESLVWWMGLQLAFQVIVTGNLARLFPDASGVVVCDIHKSFALVGQPEAEGFW